jgi:hypothetical protein
LSREEDQEDIDVRKKKAAAKKLLEQKEIKIEEGLKYRLKEIES